MFKATFWLLIALIVGVAAFAMGLYASIRVNTMKPEVNYIVEPAKVVEPTAEPTATPSAKSKGLLKKVVPSVSIPPTEK